MTRFWKAFAIVILFAAPTTFAAAEERWQTLPEPAAMPKPDQSGYAPVNGIQMYYAVFGAGDPVLLIHGGLGHADIWASQVATLSKAHKVIVADSRGHGRSTRTEQPYGYDLMASDYLALLDHLKIDKTALVGWSDGGIIRSGRDYKKMSKTPDQYDAFLAQISHMWETEPAWTKEQLAKITTPTAIVAGDHDEAIKREHTEYIASAIPGAKLIILPNASHFAMLQAPDEYSQAALDFIDAK
ncbi:alpha/beta hydrolase [Mesorhizobium sp. M0621]|uniref:alpha/beta fold hydrolase n=1 Tax=Mesorhizobium sp. M0621 TaxID=2956974 RepID=UPI0033355172